MFDYGSCIIQTVSEIIKAFMSPAGVYNVKILSLRSGKKMEAKN